MRILGLDVGRRRIGVAISDPSRTLARPMTTLTLDAGDDGVARAAETIARVASEEDGLTTIVVGMPHRLDGSPDAETPRVQAFIRALQARTNVPIVAEDERLSSREAESRLALNERDWRKRKPRLDAAAAAVILQDYLDRQA